MAENAEKVKFSHLGVDILHLICAQLCVHCCKISFRGSIRGGDYAHEKGRAALGALCQTSRFLRFLSQPFLYHRIRVLSPKSHLLLVRTLNERPDLAACVRELAERGNHDDAASWAGSDDVEYLKRVARSLKMYMDVRINFSKPQAVQRKAQTQRLSLETLIALQPNLETLSIMIRDGANSNRFEFLTNFLGKTRVDGLPNLRHLQFVKPGPSDFFLSNQGVNVLLQAAPNLEQLVMKGTKGLEDIRQDMARDTVASIFPILSKLRDLDIEGALNESASSEIFIEQLALSCPQLERFRYYAQGGSTDEHISTPLLPSRTLESLLPVRETLRSLELNFTNYYKDRFSGLFLLDPDVISQFSNLTTLKLDEATFCHHCANKSYPYHTCLTDILPQTLETLEVMTLPQSLVWDDLCELLEHAIAGSFPRLNHIKVFALFYHENQGSRHMAHRSYESEVLNGTNSLLERASSCSITVSVVKWLPLIVHMKRTNLGIGLP